MRRLATPVTLLTVVTGPAVLLLAPRWLAALLVVAAVAAGLAYLYADARQQARTRGRLDDTAASACPQVCDMSAARRDAYWAALDRAARMTGRHA